MPCSKNCTGDIQASQPSHELETMRITPGLQIRQLRCGEARGLARGHRRFLQTRDLGAHSLAPESVSSTPPLCSLGRRRNGLRARGMCVGTGGELACDQTLSRDGRGAQGEGASPLGTLTHWIPSRLRGGRTVMPRGCQRHPGPPQPAYPHPCSQMRTRGL